MTERAPNPFRFWTIAELMANPPKPWDECDRAVYEKKDDVNFIGARCVGTWSDLGAKFVVWQTADYRGILIERYDAYPNDKKPAQYMAIHAESVWQVIRLLTSCGNAWNDHKARAEQ